MIATSLPPQERLGRLIDYNPATGRAVWRLRTTADFAHTSDPRRYANRFNAQFAGRECKRRSASGNITQIDGKPIMFRRIAWAIISGSDPTEILCRDGDLFNDAITNLSEVSHSRARQKQRISANNTSGVRGVTWDKQTNSWRAHIRIAGKRTNLGRFASINKARRARESAEVRLGYGQ